MTTVRLQLMYLLLILFLFLMLVGCSTTAFWKASDHKAIMQQCSISCSGSMKIYQPEQGICICDTDNKLLKGDLL